MELMLYVLTSSIITTLAPVNIARAITASVQPSSWYLLLPLTLTET